MALMSFLFIGLNVIRLKLSRDHLEKDVRDARQKVLIVMSSCIYIRAICAELMGIDTGTE
jgi:hypothetical protein